MLEFNSSLRMALEKEVYSSARDRERENFFDSTFKAFFESAFFLNAANTGSRFSFMRTSIRLCTKVPLSRRSLAQRRKALRVSKGLSLRLCARKFLPTESPNGF
jgi:hypothetical protein